MSASSETATVAALRKELADVRATLDDHLRAPATSIISVLTAHIAMQECFLAAQRTFIYEHLNKTQHKTVISTSAAEAEAVPDVAVAVAVAAITSSSPPTPAHPILKATTSPVTSPAHLPSSSTTPSHVTASPVASSDTTALVSHPDYQTRLTLTECLLAASEQSIRDWQSQCRALEADIVNVNMRTAALSNLHSEQMSDLHQQIETQQSICARQEVALQNAQFDIHRIQEAHMHSVEQMNARYQQRRRDQNQQSRTMLTTSSTTNLSSVQTDDHAVMTYSHHQSSSYTHEQSAPIESATSSLSSAASSPHQILPAYEEPIFDPTVRRPHRPLRALAPVSTEWIGLDNAYKPYHTRTRPFINNQTDNNNERHLQVSTQQEAKTSDDDHNTLMTNTLLAEKHGSAHLHRIDLVLPANVDQRRQRAATEEKLDEGAPLQAQAQSITITAPAKYTVTTAVFIPPAPSSSPRRLHLQPLASTNDDATRNKTLRSSNNGIRRQLIAR